MKESVGKNEILQLRDSYLQETPEAGLCYTGTGMLPLLRSGDVLHVERITPRQLRFGDVAVYESDRRLLVNRFFFWTRFPSRGFGRAVIKGDNRHRFRRVLVGTYLGRVVRVSSADGELSLETRKAKVLSLAAALLSGIDGTLFGLIWTRVLREPRTIMTAAAKALRLSRGWLLN